MKKPLKYAVVRRLAMLTPCLLMLFGGCAFMPPDIPKVDHKNPPNRHINLPMDQTRKLVITTFESMGYTIGFQSTVKIITANKEVPVNGNCNCGEWHGVPIKGMAGSLMCANLKELAPGKTQITLLVRFATLFQGRNLYGMVTREDKIECASLGQLENHFFATFYKLAQFGHDRGAFRKEPAPQAQPPAAAQPAAAQPAAAPPQAPKAVETAAPPAAQAQPAKEAAEDTPEVKKLKNLLGLGLITQQEYDDAVAAQAK